MKGIETLQGRLDEFKRTLESGAPPYYAPREANALDKFHDELEYRLPIPARYVIDTSGIIRAADVNADYTIRPEPADTVKFLGTLKT